MTYYPIETRIAPLTTIRRERMLPVRGEVLVEPGQFLGPSDVVARCSLPGKIRAIDASRALGVRRDRIDRFMRKEEGDPVRAGDLLAAHRGPFASLRRNCRAPGDGEIFTVYQGLVLMEESATSFELTARMKGQVANIMPELGVVITTVGSLIQGIWGSGGESEGILKVLVDSPQKPLRAHAIDVSCHGALVVGGRILDQKALDQAVEAKVRGIIAGSVNADLCPLLRTLPFPVMITEGFGALPIAEQIFSLLQSNVGREAMLVTGAEEDRGGTRPELVIPLQAEEDVPREELNPMPLQVGMQVRVLRAPHLGAWGTVADLPSVPQVVESGARLRVAEVDLGNGEPVLVPLTNLELIR
jgi:hypothetical protein